MGNVSDPLLPTLPHICIGVVGVVVVVFMYDAASLALLASAGVQKSSFSSGITEPDVRELLTQMMDHFIIVICNNNTAILK